MLKDAFGAVSEIATLNEAEIDEVSGGGIVYAVGYAAGYSMATASSFYADLPAGVALL